MDSIMAEIYRHTQPATVIRLTVGLLACVATAGGIGLFWGGSPVAAAVCGGTALILWTCLLLFHSLSVVVFPDRVVVFFGPGLIRTTVLADDILSARETRTRRVDGWGIRRTRTGWLFNASGLQAVELERRSGRTLTIGTDEPARLHTAIVTIIHADEHNQPPSPDNPK